MPKASCQVHADLTSALELQVARDTYGFHRAHEGTQSRRKKRQAAVLQQLVGVEGLDLKGNPVQAQIPARELPRLQMIVRLQPPGVLRGGRDDINDPVTFECRPHSEAVFTALRERLGWSQISIASPPVRPSSFLRTLAKIAHSFACAERLPGSFEPTVLPLILGEPVSGTYYVGGFVPELEQDWKPVALREERRNGRTLLVAEISLHFFPKLPRYQVVCGIV